MRRYKRRQVRTALCLWIGMVTAVAGTSRTERQRTPPTDRQDVTETFFGQSVTDPYRWLENWHDAKVAQWMKAQDSYTRATLTSIPEPAKNSWPA